MTPDDNASIPNLTWTYTGAEINIDASIGLGNFWAMSVYPDTTDSWFTAHTGTSARRHRQQHYPYEGTGSESTGHDPKRAGAGVVGPRGAGFTAHRLAVGAPHQEIELGEIGAIQAAVDTKAGLV